MSDNQIRELVKNILSHALDIDKDDIGVFNSRAYISFEDLDKLKEISSILKVRLNPIVCYGMKQYYKISFPYKIIFTEGLQVSK